MKKEALVKDEFFASETKKPKRSLLRLAVLAVLLAAVVCFAVPAAQPVPQTMKAQETPAPVEGVPEASPLPLTARQQREAAYDKDLAAIRELLGQETLREDIRQQAAAQLERMVRWHQMELGIEEALVNAGFQPCLVLIQNDALTVAVSAPELTAAQSAAILSVCLTHSDVAAENIRIMPGAL